jgi:hypothetical protein
MLFIGGVSITKNGCANPIRHRNGMRPNKTIPQSPASMPERLRCSPSRGDIGAMIDDSTLSRSVRGVVVNAFRCASE